MSENLPEKQSKRIVKAKANGFGQGKHVEKHKKRVTEHFEKDEEMLSRIARKSLETMERLLDSDNDKIAGDAAHRILGHFYRPTQDVNVHHSGETEVNHKVSVEDLSPEDRALFERVQRVREEVDIIEAEEVEIIEDADE